MGYAHAVCGNYDEAREFWQKAAAQGSPEAQHNLNELAKSLE
jgi:TPR repeat protein